MLKKFSFLLCASVFFINPSSAVASDKVLSPVSSWEISQQGNDNAGRSCNLQANFEDDVILSFVSNNGQVEGITITDNSESLIPHFIPEESADANLSFLPPYNVSAVGTTIDNNSVSLDVVSSQGLIQKLGSSFILKVQFKEANYSFSLVDLKNSLRNLQSCRKAANSKPIGLISFDDNVDGSSEVVLSEATSSGNSLSAYPLGNAPEPKQEELVAVAEITPPLEQVQSEAQPIMPVPAPEPAIANEAEVEEFEITEYAAPTEMEDESQSITRIHQPSAKIRPDLHSEQEMNVDVIQEPDMAELESPEAQEVVEPAPAAFATSAQDLSKPPEFDMSNLPIPEETVNADQPVQRLASINDEQAEIYWNGKEIEGDIKPVMSQTASQAQKRPVVIPRIETADNPRRIDITNQEVAKSSRVVSNQELENELKAAQAPDYDTSYDAPVEPSASTDVAIATPAAAVDAPEYEIVTAAAPAPVQDEFLMQQQQQPQAKWTAQAGDSLREVIANWSLQENVELVWDTTEKYAVLSNLVHNDTYEKAIAGLLNQYAVQNQSNRPVGQLYIDPDTGEKMLIVQSN